MDEYNMKTNLDDVHIALLRPQNTPASRLTVKHLIKDAQNPKT